MTQEDNYYLAATVQHENGITQVWRPTIDERERARRMERIHDTAAALLREVYTNKGEF